MNIVKNRYVNDRAIKNTQKQLTFCTRCGDIHYKGFWYTSDSQFALSIDESNDRVFYCICPACDMEMKGLHAGVISITNVPQDLLGDVFSILQQTLSQDVADNPQHRILTFSVLEDGYTLTATSARTIDSVERKIKDRFENCDTKSSYEQNPKPLQITDVRFSIPSQFDYGIKQ